MFDLTRHALKRSAFANQPGAICSPKTSAVLSKVMEFDLLERGDQRARQAWTRRQIANLLAHAKQHSRFWRARLPPQASSDLDRIPFLTREELRRQVEAEGPLPLVNEHRQHIKHATSGSTGQPVTFYITDYNAGYNSIRYLAEFLWRSRPLTRNRVIVRRRPIVANAKGFDIKREESWAGPLADVFETGSQRTVLHQFADHRALVASLASEPCHQLNALPSFMSELIDSVGIGGLRRLGVEEWLSFGQHVAPDLRAACEDIGIVIRQNYSCEEAGPLAFECSSKPGYYHVASSNVLMEAAGAPIEVDGQPLHRLAVTALNSYATPLIRYELGDLGQIADACPCGHKGQTLHWLEGRASALLTMPDGRRRSMFVAGGQINTILPLNEFRLRQTEINRLLVEIVPKGTADEDCLSNLRRYFLEKIDRQLEVELKVVASIDWGKSYKRQEFSSELK